jgi:protein-tyrosine-phosphatase
MEKDPGHDPILFVCAKNAARSQMAEALARRYGMRAMSAGTHPAEEVNPTAVQVMREVGIDISKNKPKLLTKEMIEEAGLIITMGCSVEEVCPHPLLARMRKKLIEWDLPDPKDRPIEDVRRIRDEIERRVKELSESLRK